MKQKTGTGQKTLNEKKKRGVLYFFGIVTGLLGYGIAKLLQAIVMFIEMLIKLPDEIFTAKISFMSIIAIIGLSYIFTYAFRLMGRIVQYSIKYIKTGDFE